MECEWRISVNQLLFEPQVFVGLQARDEFLVNSDLQLKVAEDNVKETVYKSYYACFDLAKTIGVYRRKASSDWKSLQMRSNEMFKNGFVERLDIDKTTVNIK